MTDAELYKIEKNISRIYARAEKELTAKFNAGMSKSSEKLGKLYEEYSKSGYNMCKKYDRKPNGVLFNKAICPSFEVEES
jgi:uncharacterized protein Veg